mmetsp:Transcript_22509/g.72432  ORF Transcript_22509/g.72432 Transcript_22509/m.72432 type:complete len:210 (+) Transcript_22509:385-1014(+)
MSFPLFVGGGDVGAPVFEGLEVPLEGVRLDAEGRLPPVEFGAHLGEGPSFFAGLVQNARRRRQRFPEGPPTRLEAVEFDALVLLDGDVLLVLGVVRGGASPLALRVEVGPSPRGFDALLEQTTRRFRAPFAGHHRRVPFQGRPSPEPRHPPHRITQPPIRARRARLHHVSQLLERRLLPDDEVVLHRRRTRRRRRRSVVRTPPLGRHCL